MIAFRWTRFLAITLGVTCLCPAVVRCQPPIPDECKINGFAIGCQAYTFNRFTAFEAIEKTAARRWQSD